MKMVLVTPWWPIQFWFSMIMQMRQLKDPIVYKKKKSITLAAWLLSGEKERNRVSRRKKETT
jgi:hypothetical protein